MKKYSFFFFYYLLVSSTILLIGSIAFTPSPYKIIQATLLTPAVIYLWIRVTSPETALENQWSARFMIVILGICALGTLAYFLNTNQSVLLPSQTSDNSELKSYIAEQIKGVKEEIAQIKSTEPLASPQVSADANKALDVLSTSSKSTPRPSLGTLQIGGSADLNIYSEANLVSNILGVATHDVSYQYFEKNQNWYLIDFADSTYGWINSNNIKEIKI